MARLALRYVPLHARFVVLGFAVGLCLAAPACDSPAPSVPPRSEESVATPSPTADATPASAEADRKPSLPTSPPAASGGAAGGEVALATSTPAVVATPSAAPADESAAVVTWSCLCYRDKGDGEPRDVTACRPSVVACDLLQTRASRGTRSIIRKSVPKTKTCRVVGAAAHPGDTLGRRESWQPSARPGSFFLTGACLLDDAPARTPLTRDNVTSQESLGPVKLGMTDKEVERALGPATSKGELFDEAATGETVQSWSYPEHGLTVEMSGTPKHGQSVRGLTIRSPSPYKTGVGVGVGDSLETARALYKGLEAPSYQQQSEEQWIVGSIYGGVFFHAKDGVIQWIFIGAGAE